MSVDGALFQGRRRAFSEGSTYLLHGKVGFAEMLTLPTLCHPRSEKLSLGLCVCWPGSPEQ